MNDRHFAMKEPKEKEEIEKWTQLLPCNSCEISEVCRYKNVVKRVDYPADIFDISITCKIKDKYKEVK